MKSSSVELAIIELLNNNHLHLKAIEIFDILKDTFTTLNKSTVYRALDRLVSNEKISVSDIGTGADVYENLHNEFHHHLVCQKCNQVEMIDHQNVGDFFSTIKNEYNFEVKTNHLILFGVCQSCIAKK